MSRRKFFIYVKSTLPKIETVVKKIDIKKEVLIKGCVHDNLTSTLHDTFFTIRFSFVLLKLIWQKDDRKSCIFENNQSDPKRPFQYCNEVCDWLFTSTAKDGFPRMREMLARNLYNGDSY